MPFPRVTTDIFRELRAAAARRSSSTRATRSSATRTRASEMLRELRPISRRWPTRPASPSTTRPATTRCSRAPRPIEVLREWGHDLYGSFDFRRCHFVGAQHRRGRPRGPHHRGATRVAARRTWPRPRGARAMFVVHAPPDALLVPGRLQPGRRRGAPRAVPLAHGVEAVFSAHDHFFYEEQHDGVRYVTIGGAGGPLYTQPPAGGLRALPARHRGARTGPISTSWSRTTSRSTTWPATTAARLSRPHASRTRPTATSWRATWSSGCRHCPSAGAYRVSATARDFARVEVPLAAAPVRLAPADGEAMLGVEVAAPQGLRRVGDGRGARRRRLVGGPSSAPAEPSSAPRR